MTGSGPGRRLLGGSAVFRAASWIESQRGDLSFEDAVVLARLVLELNGGPAPLKGKRALTNAKAASRLTKIGVTRMDEGFGRAVGTRGSAGFQLSATAEGEALVAEALAEARAEIERPSDTASDGQSAALRSTVSSGEPDKLDERWQQAARYVIATDDDPNPASDRVRRVAQGWRDLGFSPADVRPWRDALVNFDDRDGLHEEATRWRTAGFDAAESSTWHHENWIWEGYPQVGFAALCRDHGWHPREVTFLYLLSARRADWAASARRWVELALPNALHYARAGMTPEGPRCFTGLNCTTRCWSVSFASGSTSGSQSTPTWRCTSTILSGWPSAQTWMRRRCPSGPKSFPRQSHRPSRNSHLQW